MGQLTARKVETAKPGKNKSGKKLVRKYGDGGGLQLAVSPTGAKKWVLRFMSDGRPREMGLGSYPEVSLAVARELAIAGRRLARSGVDPISERRKDRGIPTFGELADQIAEQLGEGFRNEKHRAQWKSTLKTYAEPLRAKPVDKIDTTDVLAALRPIWKKKPETASRVRGRIERVLNAAKAKGCRTGENPAAWRGHLENLLAKQSRLSRGHHAAMPYKDVPAFMARLRERDAVAASALEFAILTAARSGEVLGARWSEIDLDEKVWTLPPSHEVRPRAPRPAQRCCPCGRGEAGQSESLRICVSRATRQETAVCNGAGDGPASHGLRAPEESRRRQGRRTRPRHGAWFQKRLSRLGRQ